MRIPVCRTRSGIDVYVDRTPAGGTEQYGIRRIPALVCRGDEGSAHFGPRYVYVPSADLDPFEEVE